MKYSWGLFIVSGLFSKTLEWEGDVRTVRGSDARCLKGFRVRDGDPKLNLPNIVHAQLRLRELAGIWRSSLLE